MKTLLLFLGLVGLVAAQSFAPAPADAPAPTPPPTEVTLVNGAILHRVTIVRWNKDSVVLKHAGGIDPVRFVQIAPAQRAIFEQLRNEGLAEEKRKRDEAQLVAAQARLAKAEQEAKKQGQRAEIEDAIARKQVIVGMTKDDVIRAWGQPTNAGKAPTKGYAEREIWLYQGTSLDTTGRRKDMRVVFLNDVVVALG